MLGIRRISTCRWWHKKKNWLFFAKLIKDETYKKITQKIIVNPNLEKIIKINKLNNKKI